MAHLQSGIIMIWSGAIVDIPAGWQLCDGTNDTPNLQDNFVRAAGVSFAPGSTGGDSQHDHTFNAAPHQHTMLGGGGPLGAGAGFQALTQTTVVNGTTSNTGHIPPFYALAYIMFL